MDEKEDNYIGINIPRMEDRMGSLVRIWLGFLVRGFG